MDFVKNRPGAYMTDPVATEIYKGILPEMASIQMDYVPTLTYSACDDTWTLETNQPLTNATLTYNAVPAQTKDYQKYVLAPYTVAPHLLLASPNGLHKLTVDDNGNVLVDGKKIGTHTETA